MPETTSPMGTDGIADNPQSAIRNPQSPPLAIVGIGCLFPKADGPGGYWANVKNGVDCITELPPTHWDPADYFDADPKRPDMTYARRGGFLSPVDFNPLEFAIAPRDIEATDTSQLLGLVAAKQALTDAGLVFADMAGNNGRAGAVDRTRVSVILGVTGTLELVVPLGARLGHPRWRRALKEAGIPDDVAADVVERIGESYVTWQENSFPGLLGNVVAGRIANKLDLHGTNCVVDAACASSLSAVHLAAMELQTGRADVVVTGGIDTFNDVFMFMCFSKTPALSPTGDSKPFDAAGDGTILGEGLGVVVLKRLADAERDGDTVYAVLRGVGTSSDGKGNAIYAPSAEGQKRCLRAAYRAAGVTPDTIELVEAHGTGTKVGDATEAAALAEVYGAAADGRSRPWCAIGSVKSQVGHTKAAAGAASLIKAALALYYKVLPPTLKVAQPVEPLRAADSPFYVNTAMRPWLPRAAHPRRAAVSAFGFGGSNFHCVLEEHRPAKVETDWDGMVELFCLTGDTPQAVAGGLEAVPTAWSDFARQAGPSRAAFRADVPCRLVLVAHRDRTDLPVLVSRAKARLAEDPAAAGWHTPDGAHYGTGAPGKLAVLFPGQGSQYVGMLRELVCLFPEMLDTLAEADRAFAEQNTDHSDPRRLSDLIYPPPAFDPQERDRQAAALRATDVAQPALGAVEFGAWQALATRFGVAADAYAGHSYGELPALAAAGRIGATDLFALSRLRGRLMAQQPAGDGGAMLAVFAPLGEIEAAIRDAGLPVVVANKNAPAQTVLSGPTAAVEQAAGAFADRGIRTTRLPVAAAFHSPLVADAAGPFRTALDTVPFEPGAVPVFANTTAAEYPADAAAARDLLGHQLANPVAFVDEVRALAAAGVRTFLEVGPGSTLVKLAEASLADGGTGAEFVALDESGGRRPGVLDLGNALARLAARGHAVRLAGWEEGSRCRPAPAAARPGLTVPISGANYVHPRPKREPRKLPPVPAPGEPTTAGTRTMDVPTPAGADPLAQALQVTQQTLAALQRMQEQTAQLHRQFLESQEAAQRTLANLVAQQQALLFPGAIAVPAPAAVPVVPVPPPAPVPVPTTPAAAVPVSTPAPPRPAAVVPPPLTPATEPVRPAVSAAAAPAPAPRPAEAPAPTPTPAPPPTGAGEVGAALVAVVAEKTGYPADMLDLSMALDADLGIDSIKRVEILSALQDRLPHAPQVRPEHLGTLHTLRDVADFLAGGADPGTAEIEIPVATPVDSGELAPPPTGAGEVGAALVAVVAEKTGYPADMLDLSMALDADLGIDSIKRVEILSALQDRLPHAPQVRPEHLGTLHTLRDVADFLAGGAAGPAPDSAPAAPPAAVPPATPAVEIPPEAPPTSRIKPPAASELSAPATEQVSAIHPAVAGDSLLTATKPAPARPAHPGDGRNGEPARAPTPETVERSILQAVDLDLNLIRPRVPLPEGGEIWLVAEDEPLSAAVAAQLTGLGYAVTVHPWGGVGAAKGGGPLAGLVLLAPGKVRPGLPLNRLGFQWLQLAGPRLRQSSRHSAAGVVVSVARLDGAFGLAGLPPTADPTSGGLAGLIKTARHEWPELGYKAIDLAPALADTPAAAATVLAEEILSAGPIEVGLAPTHRCTLELARTVRRSTSQTISFGPKDVILVTGGARGVTAEAAIALGDAFRPTLVLTGRTAAPAGPEPAWLAGLTDEPGMKKAIADHLGGDATPKVVGEFYTKVTAQREIRRTLSRLEAAGARAAYFSVNVAAGKAVADLLHQVKVKFGPVTAVVHGAGVLADRRIENLTPEQFDQVYTTKVGGVRTMLDLLGGEELKAVVLFGSTTGRFGRTGQLAYAAANEVLNKIAQVEARKRPAARVVSINWGPWEGGMVTPALRKVFEAEGIGLIPLADGGAFVVHELNAAGRAIEVVALGSKVKSSGTTPAESAARTAPPAGPASTPAPLPVPPAAPGTSAPAAEVAVAFERAVDVASHPILRSHVLDGRAVLPMAVHLEWLAHAALHGNPGLVFHGFNDLRITHGVMVEDGATVPLRLMAGKAVKQDKLFLVPVELRGKRRDGRDVIHSRAEVVLTAALPKPPAADRQPVVQPYPHPTEEVYRYFLFHGPDLQGIEAVDGLTDVAFVGSAYPAPPPGEWFANPLRSAWVADPLVLDASFQMMILWSFAQHGAGSLPCFAGRYRQYRRAFPTGTTKVVIRVTRDNGSFARADIDYLDADGAVVAQLQDYECVIDPGLNQAFRRNQLGPMVRQ